MNYWFKSKANNIDCFVYLFFPIFELLKVLANTTFYYEVDFTGSILTVQWLAHTLHEIVTFLNLYISFSF